MSLVERVVTLVIAPAFTESSSGCAAENGSELEFLENEKTFDPKEVYGMLQIRHSCNQR